MKVLCINTHVTIMTMFEIRSTTNSTKSTIVTMVWLFFIGHPQVATFTVVYSELNSTRDTLVSEKYGNDTKTEIGC